MKIRIVMMQKDEVLLLRPWIAYHGALIGMENITVFDNGSTVPEVLDQLDEIEKQGVDVIRDYNTVEDFREKGALISGRIKRHDRESPADFYLPIDCDEFLVSRTQEGKICLDTESLQETLRPHMGSEDVLRIGFGYDNDPSKKGRFFFKGRKKCFFAQGACDFLDVGFHRGLSKKGSDFTITGVGYIHMHNKPLDFLQEDARKKMVGRVKDFEIETLISHREARGQGFHLINELLFKDENEYFTFVADKYKNAKIDEISELENKFKEIGFSIPY